MGRQSTPLLILKIYKRMRLVNYTEHLQHLIEKAQTIALAHCHNCCTEHHVLASLLRDSVVQTLITQAGADPLAFDVTNQAVLDNYTRSPSSAKRSVTQSVVSLLLAGERVSQAYGDRFVSVDSLLIAMAEFTHAHAFTQVFKSAKLSAEALRASRDTYRHGRIIKNATDDTDPYPLSDYSINVTDLARSGQLDPVIGRNLEIRRLMEVVSRRTKNNPILIGKSGVGKTAIVEGLAQRIAAEDVPDTLKHKHIIALDLGSVLAGTKFRGEFEQRFTQIIHTVSSRTDCILFIDELHLLIGAGRSDGPMDAANLLKPALAKGTLHCIGATTLTEYKRYIEKDAALTRRFQPIYTQEPTVHDTVSILRGIKEHYERHHGIKIKDSAIVAAAQLSDRYIPNRCLPDKAIDLINEAASQRSIELNSKPRELDTIDRNIMHMNIEIEALKKETDPDAKTRLQSLEGTVIELAATAKKQTAQWAIEKTQLDRIHALKKVYTTTKKNLAIAERTHDFAYASTLKYGRIPDIEAQLTILESGNKRLHDAVDDTDIASVIAGSTGIPIQALLSSQKEKLVAMETKLRDRVVGQEAAITAISHAVRRSQTGIGDHTRPIGSFLLFGPTGVGKTEVCRALSEFMFNDESAMLRIDMSEYTEHHSISRLLGAPPGYVGYETGGLLTDAVRDRPYQVVLFDEVEKAHPDVLNILLQLLDDGHVTDAKGITVDFKNTIVMITSNLGSSLVHPSVSNTESLDTRMMACITDYFRPELLNRIDEIILFETLSEVDMIAIVDIQLNRLNARLAKKNLSLCVSQKAKIYLSQNGYNPHYGARPLNRLIQREIENKLSIQLLNNHVQPGDTILIDAPSSTLTLSVSKAKN
ncbi:MAG: AAA family ATPase [Candidatus Marinamargulisbacteria bacterium]|nr:AAA family ATPase [Candidatus Marinamargulisbacteria bacterium]